MARRVAAFYDLDGTLLQGSVLDHYLYFARNDAYWGGRLFRIAETIVKAPYYTYVDSLDRYRFNEVFYASYRGLSEDRLAILGESLFQRVLKEKLYDGIQELLDQDRQLGRMQVLVTGALDFVAKPVAGHLGIERVVASRLQFDQNGLATGVLRPPVMAGPAKAKWIREFAEEHDLDLGQSVAYSDDAADLPMLSVVGRPVAINPDAKLKATARSHGWPVLYIDAGPTTIPGRMIHRASEAVRQAGRTLRERSGQGDLSLPAPRTRAAFSQLGERLKALALRGLAAANETRETS